MVEEEVGLARHRLADVGRDGAAVELGDQRLVGVGQFQPRLRADLARGDRLPVVHRRRHRDRPPISH
jgi:hypothetical protein